MPMQRDFRPLSAGDEGKSEHAKWILEKHQHWTAAAEVKAGTRPQCGIRLRQ